MRQQFRSRLRGPGLLGRSMSLSQSCGSYPIPHRKKTVPVGMRDINLACATGVPSAVPHTRARDRVAGEYRCEEIDSCQILGTATTCQVCQLLSALTIRQSEMQCLCAFSLRSGEPHMGIKSWDPCC